jgi:hypothetical protein
MICLLLAISDLALQSMVLPNIKTASPDIAAVAFVIHVYVTPFVKNRFCVVQPVCVDNTVTKRLLTTEETKMLMR